MASQVPYSPQQTVAPSDKPVPYRSIDVPLAAFGGASAVAEEHLGDQLQQTGNELFNRATALMHMRDQADATEAAASYMNNLGKLHEDYTSKQGKDAVDGLQPYIDLTNSTRNDIRKGLVSDFARRAFDTETRSMQSRAIWSASGHSGVEQRKYIDGASQARIDANSNAALSNPEDDAQFQSSLRSTKSEIMARAGLRGWSDDQTKQEVMTAQSNLWSSRIQGLAKSQPFTAQKLLDKAIDAGQMTGADAGRLTDFVQRQRYTVGARQEASNGMSGVGIQFGAGKVPIDRAMSAISSVESSGSYELRHPAATKGPLAGEQALGRYGVMPSNLQPWLKEAGMQSMSEDQFLKDHPAQDQLFKFKINQYQEEGGSFNAAMRKWFTGTYTPKAGANDGHSTVEQYLIKANASLARSASGTEVETVAKNRAKEISPEDPVFEDTLNQHFQLLHERENRVQKEDEFNNRMTVSQALGPDKNGKLPQSVEELTADPKIKTAWDALNIQDQNKTLKVLLRNVKNEYEFTPETADDYRRLVGSFKDPNKTPEDIKKFLDTDIAAMRIPWAQKSELMTMQQKLFKDQSADPKMGHALQVLNAVMSDAGIDKSISAGAHNDDYNQFVGSLHGVMEDFIRDNGKPPKDEDIQKMGSRLIRELPREGFWQSIHLSGPNKYYQAAVPDEAKKSIIDGWRKAYNTDPSENDIHNVYIAAQYKQFYGKKAKAQP